MYERMLNKQETPSPADRNISTISIPVVTAAGSSTASPAGSILMTYKKFWPSSAPD